MSDIDPDTFAQVIRRITETTHADLRWKVGGQASLKQDLCLDALDRLTIACALDEDLGIEIPDADLTEWETVADVAATVARLTSNTPAHPEPVEGVAQPNWDRLGFAGAEDAAGRN